MRRSRRWVLVLTGIVVAVESVAVSAALGASPPGMQRLLDNPSTQFGEPEPPVSTIVYHHPIFIATPLGIYVLRMAQAVAVDRGAVRTTRWKSVE